MVSRSDEGRDYQRNDSGSRKYALIRISPNKATLILLIEFINKIERTLGTETSKYQKEKKVKTISLVVANETETAQTFLLKKKGYGVILKCFSLS